MKALRWFIVVVYLNLYCNLGIDILLVIDEAGSASYSCTCVYRGEGLGLVSPSLRTGTLMMIINLVDVPSSNTINAKGKVFRVARNIE